jgi:hypothetical protein
MAGHTNVDGFVRKIATSVNGANDQTLVGFDILVEVPSGVASTTLLSALQVPANKAIFLSGVCFTSDGAAWTTGTNIKVQTSGGTDLITVLTANLPTASTAVSVGAPGTSGTSTVAIDYYKGCPVGQGLNLVQTGAYAGAARLTVRIQGVIRSRTPGL